ncbi:MAG TPA: carboxypeptidase-like regulatory domain-containing protein, partial [Planctomycetaceae bacterium]
MPRSTVLVAFSKWTSGVFPDWLIRSLEAAGLLLLAIGAAVADEGSPERVATQQIGMPWQRPGTHVSAFGTVVDAAGRPVAGAEVMLRDQAQQRAREEPWGPDPQDILASIKTDELGKFRFKDVPSQPFRWDQTWTNKPTPWDIVVQARGMGLAWKFLPQVNNKTSLDFQLRPAAELRGKVTDEHDKPIPGVTVKLAVIGNNTNDFDEAGFSKPLLSLVRSRLEIATKTDSTGRFTIAGLPRDQVASLVFDHPDFALECLCAATSDQPQPDSQGAWGDGRVYGKSKKVHAGEVA